MVRGFGGKILFVVMLASLPALSAAQERFERGWYVGGGPSLNDVYSYEDICYGCYGSATYGDSGTGLVLTAGLRANRYLAFEASWFGESTMRWDYGVLSVDNPPDLYAVDSDVSLSSLQANILAGYTGRHWEAYFRAGIASWDARSDQLLYSYYTGDTQSRSVRRNGNDFVFGIGFGRSFANIWQLRMDYAYYGIDDDLLPVDRNEDAYTDFLSLQLIRRFDMHRH